MLRARTMASPRTGYVHGRSFSFRLVRGCRNLCESDGPAAIAHFAVAVGAFVDHRLGLPGTVAAPQRQQLQETSLMPHHPVVAHAASGPNPANPLQLLGACVRPV